MFDIEDNIGRESIFIILNIIYKELLLKMLESLQIVENVLGLLIL